MNPNLLYSGHEVKNYEDWGDMGFTLLDLIVSARFHDRILQPDFPFGTA